MSRQIRDLEDELGVALFDHGARSVRLTEAGRVFLGEVREVLQRAEAAVQVAEAVGSGQRGEIHVGYAPSLTVELLQRTLRIFQEANPGVRVQLHDLSTQEMLGGLRDGKLHIALMIQVSAKAMGGLVFEELHPLAGTREVGLNDLDDERLIAFTRADYPEYHAWLAELFPRKHPPQIAEQHDSATSLIAAVEAGRGVALGSQRFDCLSGPRLKVRPLIPAQPPMTKKQAREFDQMIAGE